MVAGMRHPPALDRLCAALITDRVIYFPLRHHSPACSRHLERLIRYWQPRAVLVEGPTEFTPLIPLILHPGTRAPFAVYTSCDPGETPRPAQPATRNPPPATADPSDAEAPPEAPARRVGSSRRAAYYPFCDASPELVALRLGAEVGATLRFIDLDYPGQVRAEHRSVRAVDAARVESLLAESQFWRGRYLHALARRSGCRDHNDLWDHLFETRLDPEPGNPDPGCAGFIRDVAAWCYFARADAPAEELETEGTLAREAAMAGAIRQELELGTARILVVTGGFHTVVLPDLVAAGPVHLSAPAPDTRARAAACLIRYSYEQLDALNGYAAGMPSLWYYEQVWRAAARSDCASALADVAAKALVELGQLTRARKLSLSLSAADAIAALEQARRLAVMRHHPGPTREDLLDGVRSCFVKGSLDAEGEIVLGLAQLVLGGTGIGEVPPEAGVPPLVEDFRSRARKLRLQIHDSVQRKASLDLYRKGTHRESSRFFHSLVFLDVPFATRVGGPDFVTGSGLERLHEHWTYQWTPQTESRLVEASIHGATLEEAAASRLARAVADLENAGRGRSAADAVAMLVQACRMGLHRHTNRLMEAIAIQVEEDPALDSLTTALSQLVLLWESREPLEAHRLEAIPALAGAAFRRACFHLRRVANTPVDGAETALQSILTLRDLVRSRSGAAEPFDAGLFWEVLEGVCGVSRCPPLLAGGIAGMLHSHGSLSETELARSLRGSLGAVVAAPGEQIAFLVGLLRVGRELAWRLPALPKAVDALLATWTDEEFFERIPHLRLAFAELTPRETDQVAGVVSELHMGQPLGPLVEPDLGEAAVLAGAQLNVLLQRSLLADGLSAWLEPASPPAPTWEGTP